MLRYGRSGFGFSLAAAGWRALPEPEAIALDETAEGTGARTEP